MSIDLIFTIIEGGDFPDCPRCNESVGGRVVAGFHSNTSVPQPKEPELAYVWCIDCFLIKAETLGAVATTLRKERQERIDHSNVVPLRTERDRDR